MKKLSNKMVVFIGIIVLSVVGLSLYLINTPKEMTRIEELQVEKEKIKIVSEVDSSPLTATEKNVTPVVVEKTPQEILDDEEAIYQEIADTSLQVYAYMEQIGAQIIEYNSLYAMDEHKAAAAESRKIDELVSKIKSIADNSNSLPETAIYIESKRMAIDVINQYYDVAQSVLDKKMVLDSFGTREAYSQSENVDILMAQLVMKLDEEKTEFQKEHGLKE